LFCKIEIFAFKKQDTNATQAKVPPVNCRFRILETTYDHTVCEEMIFGCTWINLKGASRNAFLAGIAI